MKTFISGLSQLCLFFVPFVSIIAQPVITSIPVTTAVEGEMYNYTVHASGNQATMHYAISHYPEGMTIDAVSGLISWTPSSNEINAYVEAIANDGTAPADSQRFFIFIAEAPSCSDDLIAVYRLDESSGPYYTDVTGTHHATASVSPFAGAGKIDGAQVFNDNTKFLIPDNGNEWDWNSSGSFTLECWVKTTVNDKVQAYISRYNADTDVREISTSWWLGQTNTGNAAMEIKDFTNHNSVLFSSKYIADGQWHHIVGVRNSATQHNKIYVDGTEVADMSASLPGGFACPQPTPVTLGYMKRTYEWDPEYHLNGSLDEVAFYSRALSGEEIQALYNSGQPSGHCGPGNYAPVIVSFPVTEAFTEKEYSYILEVQDIDDATLSLSAINIPEWLTFNYTAGQKTAVLSGTPESVNVGVSDVTLRISDGRTTKDQVFSISVSETNHLPRVTSSPATTGKEDVKYDYQLVIDDEDPQDVITIETIGLPGWLTFSSENRTAVITGTPGNNDCGKSIIDFLITDGRDTIHYIYELRIDAVNDPPVITSVPVETANAGTVYSYVLIAEDEDSEDLTMSALSKPDWLNFSTLSGLLYGTIPASAHGTFLVTLSVSDGEKSTLQYIVITVNSAVPVQTFEETDIKVYPNPAVESLQINCGKVTGDVNLKIITMDGTSLKSLTLNSVNEPITVNISDLPAGSYVLLIQNASMSVRTKFSIIR